MITTAEPVLQEVSYMLGESSTDTSAKRIRFFNRALDHLCNQYRWKFKIKTQSFTTTAGQKEYDLTTVISSGDYDSSTGLYQVWNGSTLLDPVPFDQKNKAKSDGFYLTPDNKTLGFTFTIAGNETITLYYYAEPKDVSSHTETLNLSIPDSFRIPLATYIKHLVHESKRQRYDSRNAILDFQEQIVDLKMKDGSNKVKGLPRQYLPPFMSTQLRRRYV